MTNILAAQGFALWASLVLCAVGRGKTSILVQGGPICHYGIQPGYWTLGANNSYSWQLYDNQCQLKDLVTPLVQAAGNGLIKGGRGILFFGDSVDYRFVYYFCQELGRSPDLFGHDDLGHLKLTGICQTNQLTLAKQHLSGASLDGPYWNNINFAPIQSIDEGLEEYVNVTEAQPDVVVISSNFWDLAGWFAAANWTITGSMMENETIPNFALADWRRNMTNILTHLKYVSNEGTLLIFHTLHPPRWHHDPRFWENDRYINQHVSQLNAIGRHVAHSLHYHILDLEVMAAQVHQNSFLRDSTHPNSWFMLQALNVILNMDQAHHAHVRSLAEQAPVGRFGHLGHWISRAVGKSRTLRLG